MAWFSYAAVVVIVLVVVVDPVDLFQVKDANRHQHHKQHLSAFKEKLQASHVHSTETRHFSGESI